MDQRQWIQKFTELGAYWLHDGNPNRPHALLASGNHSDGYFDASLVIADPALLNQSGTDLRKRLEMWFLVISLIEQPMPIWAPEDCPLCQQGSEAIRPKGNSKRLTAEYDIPNSGG